MLRNFITLAELHKILHQTVGNHVFLMLEGSQIGQNTRHP